MSVNLRSRTAPPPQKKRGGAYKNVCFLVKSPLAAAMTVVAKLKWGRGPKKNAMSPFGDASGGKKYW